MRRLSTIHENRLLPALSICLVMAGCVDRSVNLGFEHLYLDNVESRTDAESNERIAKILKKVTREAGLPASASKISLATFHSRDPIYFLVFDASQTDLDDICRKLTGREVDRLSTEPFPGAERQYSAKVQDSLPQGFPDLAAFAPAPHMRYFENNVGLRVAVDTASNRICIRD